MSDEYRARTFVPALVKEAEALALELGFTLSCRPEVGRLLHTLAAATELIVDPGAGRSSAVIVATTLALTLHRRDGRVHLCTGVTPSGGIVEYQPPVRRSVDVSEVGKLVGTLIEEIARGRVRLVVQQDGKDVAALVSAYDLERLQALDRDLADGLKVIEELHARFAHLDPEEVERDIAEAIAEVRAEARARARAEAPATPTT